MYLLSLTRGHWCFQISHKLARALYSGLQHEVHVCNDVTRVPSEQFGHELSGSWSFQQTREGWNIFKIAVHVVCKLDTKWRYFYAYLIIERVGSVRVYLGIFASWNRHTNIIWAFIPVLVISCSVCANLIIFLRHYVHVQKFRQNMNNKLKLLD